MKGFIGGVFATVIGGFLLLLATEYYGDWKKKSQQSLDIAIRAGEIELTSDTLKKFKFDTSTKIIIDSVVIKNNGSDPILDKKLFFDSEIGADSVIHDWGVVNQGESTGDLTIKAERRGFFVEIAAIDPGKEAQFWVAYDCCELFTATTRSPNMSITQTRSENDASGLDFLWWFGGAVVILFAFVIGAAVESVTTRGALMKRGVDVTEVMKWPEDDGKK